MKTLKADACKGNMHTKVSSTVCPSMSLRSAPFPVPESQIGWEEVQKLLALKVAHVLLSANLGLLACFKFVENRQVLHPL